MRSRSPLRGQSLRAESWLARMGTSGLAERAPSTAEQLLAWREATNLSVLADELESVAAAEDLRPRARELDMPVQVLCGALDQAVPPAWGEHVAIEAPDGALSCCLALDMPPSSRRPPSC